MLSGIDKTLYPYSKKQEKIILLIILHIVVILSPLNFM